MQLLLEQTKSPIGNVLIVTDDAGALCALDFEDCESRMRRLVARYFPQSETIRTRAASAYARNLDAYFAGELDAFDAARLAFGGTVFQRATWAALRRIPAGTTTTYGDIARTLGRPAAVRAVGAANGSNPIAIAVPCHRVVGADGALTGYAGGLARKRFLLAHEGAAAGRVVLPMGTGRATVRPVVARI